MTDAAPDPLERFVAAQAPVWASALAELRRGRKQGHWMWFVFPQLAGLGRSPTARLYALAGLEEARAYLAHPLLGARLVEAVEAVLPHAQAGAERVFGGVDALKFRSSMTLFEAAALGGGAPFGAALERFYGGERDSLTLAKLG